MRISINNSVPYKNYLQNVNNKVIPYCFFFTIVLKDLHAKRNVSGKGWAYANEIKDYIGSGCMDGLYSNKQISYQGQPKVFAKSDNS